jgi:hypothetical protein
MPDFSLQLHPRGSDLEGIRAPHALKSAGPPRAHCCLGPNGWPKVSMVRPPQLTWAEDLSRAARRKSSGAPGGRLVAWMARSSSAASSRQRLSTSLASSAWRRGRQGPA